MHSLPSPIARRWTAPVALVALALTPAALADVRLPQVFSDHMLLQRDVPVAVWGQADPGEEVSVRFAGQEVPAVADATGHWSVRLAPLEASAEGRRLEVQGANAIVLDDVLVGDVWICSGQSNMEWTVKNSLDSEAEIAAASFPTLRLFNVPGHTVADVPRADVPGGSWTACTPTSVAGFSAVGYFFARDFQRETGVPVGLIGTNWGGTRIEPWTPPCGFRAVPELAAITAQVDAFDIHAEAGQASWKRYLDSSEAWVASARQALSAGTAIPARPASPGPKGAGEPTAIYNAMVHGLAPYSVRGALWYQGEANGSEGIEYYHKMRALIGGWREVWDQGEHPIWFYWVQLANFRQPTDDPAGGDGWARLREAQLMSLEIPNTGMAVITDIGVANDIHPRNKQDVGARLARWALRDVAGRDVVVSGPLYTSMATDGGAIRLSFDHVGSGLMVGAKEGLEPTRDVQGGELARFAIAGEDRVWHWAKAQIDGPSVVVSCDEVAAPVAVRYAWSMNPAGANLYNKEGLPASPFRTDDW